MSYLTNLLTSTTSRYTSLRRTLLSSSSEDDSSVDDPEDSHVSRVLRAYYTEKGRSFPAWLGAGPRAQQQQQGFETSRLGSLRGQKDTGGGRGSGAGLSDLWSDSPGPVRGEETPGSLRRGGLGAGRMAPRAHSQQPQQHRDEGLSARPLPSQRAGSYQTQNQGFAPSQAQGLGRNMSPVPPSSSGSGSVQERLKARLGGGRLTPAPNSPSGEVGNRFDDRGGGGYMTRGERPPAAGNPYFDGGGRGRGHEGPGGERMREQAGYGQEGGLPANSRPR